MDALQPAAQYGIVKVVAPKQCAINLHALGACDLADQVDGGW